MRNILKLSVVLLMMLPLTANAQKKADQEGMLTYSLPSTTIMLEVEAVQERFYAGPYAKYAEKYLGIKARQKDETTFQLTQVRRSGSEQKIYHQRQEGSDRWIIPETVCGRTHLVFGCKVRRCVSMAFPD